MKVWLVTVGEPLPTDKGNQRLYRTGIAAEYLCKNGHDVLWWTSTFDHVMKVHRFADDTTIEVSDRFRIALLRSVGYSSNVSLRRLVDHSLLGRKFRRKCRTLSRPDIILVSLPTLELAVEACEYAKHHAVPAVVDIRDLWPDVFVDEFPAALKTVARGLLAPYRHLARRACVGATGIIAPVQHYVDWGVNLAGRPSGPADREFPFAYPSLPPKAGEIEKALGFWKGRGLTGDSHFNICFFGTLGRQFDLNTVIAAAGRLASIAPSVRIIICGTGDRENHYRQLASEAQNVHFAGWVGSAEIWALMRFSKLGLAPYLPTPNFVHHLPNKPIEYLSGGLPVVTSLEGTLGNLLITHDCGVVYEPGNAEDLARKIQQLAGDPIETARLSANATALYQARFVADSVYGQLVRYLERVASKNALEWPPGELSSQPVSI